ncbi:DUF1648 domain-containing protein [Polaribacter haliotis]|uniref:DUF1648 domain-containing protein n=1 Tax=Polaribacter haliotis TaxID=1888915 RepID=A0A7L8AIU4_9FLAO|nr:DUF1648 domain-containing protein [Polaribacter haliotis]
MLKKHRNIIIFSAIINILSWFYVIFSYNSLPNKIVGHMDFSGHVTRYDDKSIIWILLLIFTALGIFIFWITRNQKQINYNMKSLDSQKTTTLISLPYISILMFLLVFSIIKKSKFPSITIQWLFPLIIIITIIFLIFLFSGVYKNLKS